MTKPRLDLADLIAQHLGDFEKPAHIDALFCATVDDLQRGGVDLRRVLASMISAWSQLVAAEIGTPGAVNVLRDIADLMERPLIERQKKPN